MASSYENPAYTSHQLTLEGRERLTVSGVEDVERFDENTIVMSTTAGTLVIAGENLHIGKLSWMAGNSMWTGRLIPCPMRTRVTAGAGC